MTWTSDEKSTHDSGPQELYKFTAPQTAYYLTEGNDYAHSDGNTYVRTTIERRQLKSGSEVSGSDLEITLPASEQIIQDFAFDIGERTLDLELIRVHPETGSARTIWQGSVSAPTVNRDEATMLARSTMAEALDSEYPPVVFQPVCNHKLGDSRCTVDLALQRAFDDNGELLDITQTRTVDAIDSSGTVITVSGFDPTPADGFYKAGEIVRNSDGERRSVLKSTSPAAGKVDLTITWPFKVLNTADGVDVIAGDDHTLETCRNKFRNALNFGGHPFIPRDNLWRIPGGAKNL